MEKKLLQDLLKRYLPEIGFKVVGNEGPATDDELDHIIDDFMSEPDLAA